jgi:hypothetical protein
MRCTTGTKWLAGEVHGRGSRARDTPYSDLFLHALHFSDFWHRSPNKRHERPSHMEFRRTRGHGHTMHHHMDTELRNENRQKYHNRPWRMPDHLRMVFILFYFLFFFSLQEAKGGNVFVEESHSSVLWHCKARHRDACAYACACGWGYLFFFARGCFFPSMDKDDPRYFPSLIT